MSEKLTKAQVKAIQLASQDPEWELHRWEGGFWTFAGCKGRDPIWSRDRIPDAYVTIGTLAALERKGLAEVRARNILDEPRRFRITDAGRAALENQP